MNRHERETDARSAIDELLQQSGWNLRNAVLEIVDPNVLQQVVDEVAGRFRDAGESGLRASRQV